jgi:hypothetical protein
MARTPSPRPRLDQRGVALPLALLGLVAISLMVTAALLTSSTEAAVSRAQADATVNLYRVESGIQAYIANRGANLAPVNNAAFTPPGGPAMLINVAQMFVEQPDPAIPNSNEGAVVHAIRAEPAPTATSAGGRSLVAMVRVPATFMALNIDAGATLGSNTDIGGSIDINSTSTLCATDTAAQAVLHAEGTELELRGAARDAIGNDTATFDGDRDELAEHVLNGLDLVSIARRGDIKWGKMLTDTFFTSLPGRPSGAHSNLKLRWGCPPEMVTSCPAGTDDDFPLVAIDARTSSGGRGTVTLEGDYGQGMLVIINGNLVIRGNFLYKGIILVEGNTDIHGGSGGAGTKIQGALLGLGDLEICHDDDSGDCTNALGGEGENDLSSGAVIEYNRCAIEQVQSAINQRPIQQRPNAPTFGWFELVR